MKELDWIEAVVGRRFDKMGLYREEEMAYSRFKDSCGNICYRARGRIKGEWILPMELDGSFMNLNQIIEYVNNNHEFDRAY